MVSQIPRDVSAQIYFEMGHQLPENLTKHAKIFQKMIQQISFSTKKQNQPKKEFEHFSDDFQTYVNKSKCHEVIVVDYYINMAETFVIFKITNLTLNSDQESIPNRLMLKPNDIYQCKVKSGF